MTQKKFTFSEQEPISGQLQLRYESQAPTGPRGNAEDIELLRNAYHGVGGRALRWTEHACPVLRAGRLTTPARRPWTSACSLIAHRPVGKSSEHAAPACAHLLALRNAT